MNEPSEWMDNLRRISFGRWYEGTVVKLGLRTEMVSSSGVTGRRRGKRKLM